MKASDLSAQSIPPWRQLRRRNFYLFLFFIQIIGAILILSSSRVAWWVGLIWLVGAAGNGTAALMAHIRAMRG